MKKILGFISSWSYAQREADHFLEGAFLTTAISVAFCAWIWIGQGVASGKIQARYGLILLGFIAGVCWIIYHFFRSRYIETVTLFLVTQSLFIGLMIFLTKDLTPGYLFLFTVVMAGSLIGPAGSVGVAAGATLIELALVYSLPNQLNQAGILPVLVLLQCLAALTTGQAARGLHAALEASEISAREARMHAEEARKHRGELHRTLKSLDLAYAQLQRVNAELLQAREIADAALRFKKEFAAQTSHELRTPLNLIIGFSETMAFSQHSYGVKLPPAYLRDVTEIHRNSRHLLSLIDDILDLSKLESGRMGLRFNLVDVQELLQEVVTTIQPLVQAKRIEFIFDVPELLPELWLDRARIHQVLLNLLSNAARLTQQGQITLRAELLEMQNHLLIQVKDTGPGIAEDMLPHVFEEYRQAGEAAGAAGTTGLGLAISKRIVELHGGHIWVESRIAEGSIFSFVLPVHKPLSPLWSASHPAIRQLQETKPAVVVLGEEDSDEVKLLQRHLEGYVIASAPSWKYAQQMVETSSARAIITSSSAELPAEPAAAGVPIVSCPLPSSKETAHALGVAGYVRKPLTIHALQSTLKQAAPKAKSLLIIDDDPSSLRLIERMTKGSGDGYKIFRAYDTLEALRRVQAQVPDAILIDQNVPGDECQELISKLKASPDFGSIPIILISGYEPDDSLPRQPITLTNPKGFTQTEVLKYLQGILAAAPPSAVESGTTVPPSPANHSE
ncbi:MAG: response regulator [Chloroflexota bacterium]|nr:MAG: response regulator [Chloroflexota bacterium]